MLYQRATIEAGVFSRSELETDKQNPEISANIYQLFEIFREILDRQKAITEIEIAREEQTMAEKIVEIKSMLQRTREVSARLVFEKAKTKREAVLTFLALLELVKELQIRLRQADIFGDIIIMEREAVPESSATAEADTGLRLEPEKNSPNTTEPS